MVSKCIEYARTGLFRNATEAEIFFFLNEKLQTKESDELFLPTFPVASMSLQFPVGSKPIYTWQHGNATSECNSTHCRTSSVPDFPEH